MAAINLLLALVIISVIACEASNCGVGEIEVEQEQTGRLVEGKEEYEVVVSNTCACSQSMVVVRCYGLSSVERLDTEAIKPVNEETCVVAGGRSIARGSPVRFKYAWLTPQDFPVISSRVHC